MLNYFANKTTSNPLYAGFLAKKQSNEHARHHEKKPEWQPLFRSQFLNLCRAQPDTLRTAKQHLGNRTLYYQGNYWSVSLQATKLSSTIHRYSHVSGNRMVSICRNHQRAKPRLALQCGIPFFSNGAPASIHTLQDPNTALIPVQQNEELGLRTVARYAKYACTQPNILAHQEVLTSSSISSMSYFAVLPFKPYSLSLL